MLDDNDQQVIQKNFDIFENALTSIVGGTTDIKAVGILLSNVHLQICLVQIEVAGIGGHGSQDGIA